MTILRSTSVKFISEATQIIAALDKILQYLPEDARELLSDLEELLYGEKQDALQEYGI